MSITSVDPLIMYIESMLIKDQYRDFQETKPQIKATIAKIIEKKSEFKITGITGMFIANKPIQN